ncbi:hypothetical protein DYB31_016210, partial [Aphanomyces astaci]
MKFFAALVHAAVAASSQAGADPLALVFDSLAHRDAEGQPIFLSQNLGVQFCSPRWQKVVIPLLAPNTTYSFTVFSNGETLDESPISLEGAKAFTTTNDPNAD